ncbi:putative FCP1 homology domain-containing protein [Cyphellophora attinorum]|uniref:Putative FCP1 homology domain-containing protein n=1 Tax=Cyphellophora attinorum TaxID=1664694 RepID=A0A0N1H7Q5_9EURO|nr:putative FCP1 homology domain-containing protein [Phialophora attinorum]KPI37690.1 putative FCP1 homology domain-containing protein [Phialophora attinorum]
MSLQSITNAPHQWTNAGYSALSVPPPYISPYPYNPSLDAMGRKKGGAFYTPVYPAEWTPDTRHTQAQSLHVPQQPRSAQSIVQSLAQSRRSAQNQASVSKRAIYNIVDAWRAYKSDTTNQYNGDNQYQSNYQQLPHYQQQVPEFDANFQPLPPYQQQLFLPSFNPQWSQQSLWTAAQTLPQPPQLAPQATAFRPVQRLPLQPQSSTHEHHAQDQIIQSIETDDVPRQLPIRPVKQRSARQPTPRRGPTPINEAIAPVKIPEPSQTYLHTAALPSQQLLQPQKLLVLLDLNGTLVYRTGYMRREVVKRPGVDRLVQYLFANHHVMLFTSATLKSAERMAKTLLTPEQYSQLITIRSREDLDLTHEQFINKVQVYKDLNVIWKDKAIVQAAPIWVVIKAKSHPHNLLQVTEFLEPEPNASKKEKAAFKLRETVAMRSVEEKLESLKWQVNVACCIREWQEAANKKKKKGLGLDAEEASARESLDEAEKAIWSRAADEEYATPVSMDGNSSGIVAKPEADDGATEPTTKTHEEEEEEYEPDEWQGVKLPTPSPEVELGAVEKLKALAGSVSKPATAPPGKRYSFMDARDSGNRNMSTAREVSPVTEEDFKWLSLDEKTSADVTKAKQT